MPSNLASLIRLYARECGHPPLRRGSRPLPRRPFAGAHAFLLVGDEMLLRAPHLRRVHMHWLGLPASHPSFGLNAAAAAAAKLDGFHMFCPPPFCESCSAAMSGPVVECQTYPGRNLPAFLMPSFTPTVNAPGPLLFPPMFIVFIKKEMPTLYSIPHNAARHLNSTMLPLKLLGTAENHTHLWLLRL